MRQEQGGPAAVVQAQLDAYNAHDVAALVAVYADDVEHYQHPSTLLASGTEAIRSRFTARFASAKPHAVLLQRIVCGDTVIDHETVHSTTPDGPASVDMVAIYEVRAGRIARAWFMTAPAADAAR
ncbi:nuclear transport factor 2 family protein [Janthinobacterium fluminis]|uniref:Nuclear transport factor 2 family protein n=1 Tax=Janthinobacterium fluminis TaxID=2987524 RepID=A0ABT5K1J3_9BURK|nr:nuclear transport factor 2 family protein [Janthinobacterium fluminis]MDC8758858.1 nuclear transport factor 2 family protein [Janthinobacterium fluminis]